MAFYLNQPFNKNILLKFNKNIKKKNIYKNINYYDWIKLSNISNYKMDVVVHVWWINRFNNIKPNSIKLDLLNTYIKNYLKLIYVLKNNDKKYKIKELINDFSYQSREINTLKKTETFIRQHKYIFNFLYLILLKDVRKKKIKKNVY